jgi:hypothetical protein
MLSLVLLVGCFVLLRFTVFHVAFCHFYTSSVTNCWLAPCACSVPTLSYPWLPPHIIIIQDLPFVCVCVCVCVSQKFSSSWRIVYLLLWLIEVWWCPAACHCHDVSNWHTTDCVQYIVHSLLTKSLIIKLHHWLNCWPWSTTPVTDTLC